MPSLRPRARPNGKEYYEAKRSLEGLLFGRLENATPIKRMPTLVCNTVSQVPGGCDCVARGPEVVVL